MTVLDFFTAHPVFSREEFIRFLTARGAPSVETANVHLKRYLAAGRIARVKRGVYFAAGPGETAERAALDFPLMVSRLTPDAVLAYHTALEAHGYAQSLFERLFFLTTSKAKPVVFRGRRFVPVVPSATLRRKKKAFAFCTEVERRGLPCRVTTVERTLVDVLDRPDLTGGLEEAWRSLAGIPMFDLEVVVQYVRLCGQGTLAAKVGFFLEQHQEALGVPTEILERLRRMRPRQPHYLDRRLGGRMAPGWNLVVPPPLLAGEWEAVR
ncbi:MAG: transcriptional regulator [candidate division NC10 bacterium]|nr:transcriptional regulator [candidate division NC10 bacterium]